MTEFVWEWQLLNEDEHCATFGVYVPNLGTILRFVEKRKVFDAEGNPVLVRDENNEPKLDEEGKKLQQIEAAAVCAAVLPGIPLVKPGTPPPGPGIVLPGPGFNPRGGVQ